MANEKVNLKMKNITLFFTILFIILSHTVGFSQESKNLLTDKLHKKNTKIEYSEKWLETDDTVKIFFREWLPANQIKGVIILVHGLMGYGEWFKKEAQKMGEKGYITLSFDRRGSGKSKGKRGHIEDFNIWINDLDNIVQWAKLNHQNLPIFLIGESLGTLFTFAYSLKHPEEIQGIVALSPATHTNGGPNSKQKIKIIMHGFKQFLTFDNPFYDPEIEIEISTSPSLLTNNKVIQQKIEEDNLVLRNVTAPLYAQVKLLKDYVLDSTKNIHTPVFIILSTDDEIINSEQITTQFYEILPNANNKILKIQKLKHCLLLEECHELNLLDSIDNWLFLQSI